MKSEKKAGQDSDKGDDMRLTEQESQEIVRFIEADKPLPEKYRFLLFEDKREEGQPDRGGKGPDREGEQGCARDRQSRSADPAMDGLD